MSEVLVVNDVAMRFGPIRVLEAIDLRLKQGERHALLGPNGAGKSTLFNLISGRFAPTAGTILLDGKRIDGQPPHRLSRMGLARSFQITHIFDGLSVRENIYMAVMSGHGRRWSMLRSGAAWRTIQEETDQLLKAARLDAMCKRTAGTLTYSEQRSLEICMTVATKPSLILLDEPTAGMSHEETSHMIEFISRITSGRTLLMVEHDMGVVFGLADRISVLVNGRILATGTPEEIRANQQVQDAYLGGGAT